MACRTTTIYAAHKHAAGLDIDGADGVTEQHDRENEPGGTLADNFFGVAPGIVGGGSEIGKDNGGGAPEGDELSITVVAMNTGTRGRWVCGWAAKASGFG